MAATAVPSLPDLRRCSNCGKDTATTFKWCGRCKRAVYCDSDCQKQAWVTGHKAVCSPATPEEATMLLPAALSAQLPPLQTVCIVERVLTANAKGKNKGGEGKRGQNRGEKGQRGKREEIEFQYQIHQPQHRTHPRPHPSG
eukprot:m.236957 g.236957  ORF g.236957 m.236957 type:complete len:141 (+) comp18947_c0_seq1:135-557(+)